MEPLEREKNYMGMAELPSEGQAGLIKSWLIIDVWLWFISVLAMRLPVVWA